MSTSYETIVSSQLVTNTFVRPVTLEGGASTSDLTSITTTNTLWTATISGSATPNSYVAPLSGQVTTTIRFSPSQSSSPTDAGSSGLTTGAAVGVGIGATLGVLLIGAIIGWFFWRRRRRAKTITVGTRSKVEDPFADGAVPPAIEKDGVEKFEADDSRRVAEAPGERDHVEAGGGELAELEANGKPDAGQDQEKK